MRLLAPVLCAAAVACGPSPQSHPSLLPDVGAPPRIVALSVNSARRATLRTTELVTNLVNGLPASTQFLVLANDPSAFVVARNDRPGRVRFLEVPFKNSLTIWTQDPFLVLTGTGGATTLLTSKDFERADDRLMADVIARETGFQVKPSSLYFEGGNIVSDSDHVLIGANTIRHNAVKLGVPEQEVVLRFEEELGRSVLVIGPFPQPIGHIDMMMTPLGNRRIALADPAAGAAIAERALKYDPSSVAAFERWCEEYFFGDPSIHDVAGAEGRISAPDVHGRTAEMIARSRTLATTLDGVARALEQHGYRVDRIPMLFGGPDTDDGAADHERPLRATYPMLTYNNVLIAEEAGARQVFLPRYGWPAMDDEARRAWEGLGFTPQPIDGLTISAMYGGALRCAVKVLIR